MIHCTTALRCGFFTEKNNFAWNCRFLEICRRNTIASTKTFTERYFERNFALHFTSYLSFALFKILLHSKTVKNAKKLSVFGENDSRCLSNFLKTHVFRNLDHISRAYKQMNNRNIWFAKVIIILIMTTQVLLFDFFFRKRAAPCWVMNEFEGCHFKRRFLSIADWTFDSVIVIDSKPLISRASEVYAKNLI